MINAYTQAVRYQCNVFEPGVGRYARLVRVWASGCSNAMVNIGPISEKRIHGILRKISSRVKPIIII